MNTSILYRRCRQVVDKMLEDGFTTVERVRWIDIEPYIAMYCGADPRTLDKYRHYITYFGFFKECQHAIFEWCERDKFGNPVKSVQTSLSLLRVLSKHKTPRRNY